jgi:hypothetical protein
MKKNVLFLLFLCLGVTQVQAQSLITVDTGVSLEQSPEHFNVQPIQKGQGFFIGTTFWTNKQTGESNEILTIFFNPGRMLVNLPTAEVEVMYPNGQKDTGIMVLQNHRGCFLFSCPKAPLNSKVQQVLFENVTGKTTFILSR